MSISQYTSNHLGSGLLIVWYLHPSTNQCVVSMWLPVGPEQPQAGARCSLLGPIISWLLAMEHTGIINFTVVTADTDSSEVQAGTGHNHSGHHLVTLPLCPRSSQDRQDKGPTPDHPHKQWCTNTGNAYNFSLLQYPRQILVCSQSCLYH